MIIWETDAVCQKDSNPPRTLTLLFWGSPVDRPARELFERVFREFEAANPSVTVKANFYWPEQYKSKLRVLMAVNKVPDIFMTWAGNYFKPFVMAGKVMPLDEILENDPTWRSSFIDDAFEPLRFDGKVYAVPTARVTAVLFYNKDIFSRLGLEKPSTYVDLKKVIIKLRSAGITPIAFGNKDPWMGGMLAGQIAQRLGGKDLFTKIISNDVSWTHPVFIRSGEILQELVETGAFPEAPNTVGYTETVDMFYHGNAAMMLLGSWTLQHLVATNSLPENTIGVMNFPSFESGTGSMQTWMGQSDMNLGINIKTNNKKDAVAFLKWITSERYQRDMIHQAGLLPATKVLPDKSRYIRPELLSVIELQKEMEATYPFPDIELGGDIGQQFIDGIKKIFAGGDPKIIFTQLQENVGSKPLKLGE